MKKLCVVLLIAVMACNVTACGGSEDTKAETKTEDKTESKEEVKDEPEEETEEEEEEGDGVTTVECLKALNEKIMNRGFEEDITYEDVKECVGGVAGLKVKDDEDDWTDEKHTYVWTAEDGNYFYQIVFDVEADGTEIYNNASYSNGL